MPKNPTQEIDEAAARWRLDIIGQRPHPAGMIVKTNTVMLIVVTTGAPGVDGALSR